MEKWQWTAILLCCFGFFKELRPSEPFVTKYLIDYKGFSKETIVHVAYPIATYTYFAALPVIFLVTDFLRYRPIILLEGAAFFAVFAMLIWTNGLAALKVIEVAYGVAGASGIAYYTYMYAKVDRANYKKVTSYTYSAVFAGNFVAAVMSQVLVSFHLMDYHQLNYISMAGVSVALIISLFLPQVQQSVYFYRNELSEPDDTNSNDLRVLNAHQHVHREGKRPKVNLTFVQRIQKAYPILWTDFKNAYTKFYIVKWSIWWAIATAGHLQISNYYQTLWEEIDPNSEDGIYNGAVSAVQSALSAIFAFGIGHLKVPWSKYGESFLCLISFIQGAVLTWFACTQSLLTGYVLLVVYRTLYQILITVASAEVAQGIDRDSYGLVFGFNTFAAGCIQTILTLVINEKGGFELDIRSQFIVYGGYYGALGLAFLAVLILSWSAGAGRLGGEDVGTEMI